MAESYDISTVDLDDDEYEVKQALVRNKYAVRDGDGDVALRAKQQLFKLKEAFPFVTGDDEPAFTVKASGILDVHESEALVQPIRTAKRF